MSLEGADTQTLQRAEAEGMFKGQVLNSLTDIKNVLNSIQDRFKLQDEKIEKKADQREFEKLVRTVETKADGAEVKAVVTKTDGLQRFAYIGLGIVGTIEFLLGIFKH